MSLRSEAIDTFWNEYESDRYFYIPTPYCNRLPSMIFETVYGNVVRSINGVQQEVQVEQQKVVIDPAQFEKDIQVIFCDMLNNHFDQNNLDELLKTGLVTAQKCQQCGKWTPRENLVTYANGYIHPKELKKNYPQTLFQWFKKKVAV